MGMEMGSEITQVPVETVNEVNNSFLHEENGTKESGFNVPIKFGSHDEEQAKEGGGIADAKFPKDAADEWPAPRQIHSFYFVRYRPLEDPKIKAKIDQVDREIQRTNQSRFQILEELKAKRLVRGELMERLKTLRNENDQYQVIVEEKKKEIEPLQQALGKLRTGNTGARGGGLCSSEEELNDLINGLRYCIEHESIPLTEEKKLLREIKQLEGTREKVIANAAVRAKIQDSLGQKEAIQDQVKLMGVDLVGVRKEKQAIGSRIGELKEKVKALDAEIKSLQDDLEAITVKRDKAFENMKSLRQQRDDGNVHFYNSRKSMTEAKELAAKKDVQALEKLAEEEVEIFMALWSSNKAFRDDYEKRILPSLDIRQLSRDGRIRNPDEKPLLVVETPLPSEPEPTVKGNVKRVKEEPKSAPQKDTLATQNVQKDSKTTPDRIDAADEFFVPEKEQKITPVEKEIDEAKLKELKREEEMAKAKQAMERKKKLADKAAAKAAIRAQKEAEKKLKDREKKLKKKAAASAPSADGEEPSEAVGEEAETEKVEVHNEPAVPVKEKVRKESSVSYRARPKGSNSLSKAILRKKKSTNYWTWAAAAAALLILVFAVLGYYYFF